MSTDPAPFEDDVAAFLDAAKAARRRSFEEMAVAEARAAYLAGRGTTQLPVIEIGASIDDSLPGRAGPIPIRRYLPDEMSAQIAPAILFFHGGGWVIGDLDTHDSLCRHIVHATGMQLVAVEYRLAPEHPFPAAVEDAFDAHAMLLDRAELWNIDPRRVVVMGDSAGATLAAVTSMHARDRCLPMPAAQILFYPVTDMALSSESHARVAGIPMTTRTMRWFRSQYVAPGQSIADWRLSPLRAESLVAMPPSFITVAGHDPLHDEGAALADRLRAEGNLVTLRSLPGQIHGYLTLGGVVAEAARSIGAAATFLREQVPAEPRSRKIAALTV